MSDGSSAQIKGEYGSCGNLTTGQKRLRQAERERNWGGGEEGGIAATTGMRREKRDDNEKRHSEEKQSACNNILHGVKGPLKRRGDNEDRRYH